MKKNIIPIISLSCLLMACETKVQFTGVVETDPQFVMHANLTNAAPLRVYVGRTYFFLDKAISETFYNIRYENGERIYPTYGVVDDAQVQYQVNDGPWNDMYYELDSIARNQKVGFFKANYIPNEGETVRIRATHATLGTATTEQTIPVQPKFKVTNIDYDVYENPRVMKLQMHIDSYDGDSRDYLQFYPYVSVEYFDENKQLVFEQTSFSYYSENNIFSHSINRQYNTYYYPFQTAYMMVPAPILQQDAAGQDITFAINLRAFNQRDKEKFKSYRITTEMTVSSWTEEKYLYFCSLAKYRGQLKDEYTTTTTIDESDLDYDVSEIIDEMYEIVNEEIGMEAGIQIYSNVDGGIGHCAAESMNTLIYDNPGQNLYYPYLPN